VSSEATSPSRRVREVVSPRRRAAVEHHLREKGEWFPRVIPSPEQNVLSPDRYRFENAGVGTDVCPDPSPRPIVHHLLTFRRYFTRHVATNFGGLRHFVAEMTHDAR
jgi:hypothetical protein